MPGMDGEGVTLTPFTDKLKIPTVLKAKKVKERFPPTS